MYFRYNNSASLFILFQHTRQYLGRQCFGKILSDKHLQKDKTPEDEDPMEASRSIHIIKEGRANYDRVFDGVSDAGQQTRNTSQIVKLVNFHLNERMKHLQKIKEAAKKFDDEINILTGSAKEESERPQSKSISANNEIQVITNELAALINKHGFKKLSEALEILLSQNPELKDRI